LKKFFQQLFGSTQEQNLDIQTKPLSLQEIEANQTTVVKNHLEPPQLIVGCGLSVGLQREHNEDALFTLTTTLTSDHSNLPFGLYIVADGMGGHQHGELASGIAIRAMASSIIHKLYIPLIGMKPKSPEGSMQEIMAEGVQEAHRAIVKEVPGGGTTLTSMLILGDQLTIAHVGDSRAYAISNDGKVEALTRDHSLVKRLVELGQITTEEAAVHPQRNVLYRALGQGEPFDTDMKSLRLPESGYLMLCSDGLWNVVSDAEIRSVTLSSASPEIACQELVKLANEAGGPDNITVILVRIPE
jgi:protein phosphatase